MLTRWLPTARSACHGGGIEPSWPLDVLLSLGANLGSPVAQIARAVQRVAAISTLVRVSSVYRTAPVGLPGQPDFFNIACLVRTDLSPQAVLGRTAAIERELGRVRGQRNGPRTLDIDLLSYESVVMDTPDLQLPHPRLHLRGFVLWPLQEIAPEWLHPLLRLTPGEMIRRAEPLERVERLGPLAYESPPTERSP